MKIQQIERDTNFNGQSFYYYYYFFLFPFSWKVRNFSEAE